VALQAGVEDVVDRLLNVLLALWPARPDTALAAIRQHQDRRLARLRPRAGIREICRIDFHPGLLGALQRLLVKIRHLRGAVMLHDEVTDPVGQAVAPREPVTLGHMPQDNPDALPRIVETVMRIHPVRLVLYKEMGVQDLAGIVVHGCHAHQRRIRIDLLRAQFRQVRHLKAVLVGARRLAQQALQERMVGLHQLDELETGWNVQHVADHVQPHQRQRRRQHAVRQRSDDLRQEREGIDRTVQPQGK